MLTDGTAVTPAPLRVAVIDDHELVREGLASLMNSQVNLLIDVVYCGGSVGGAEAASPDVAILDIDLGPGSTSVGQGVLALQGAGCRVLIISAFEDPTAVRSALEMGAPTYRFVRR